jgi:acyl carrier protein
LKNLPSPVGAELLDSRPERSPASPIEERLLAMVREILGSKSVSAQDSFFLAGGHSLLGMQLVMRLRETFGVELTLRQLFEAPTVERLAVVIESLLIDSIDSLSEEEAKTQLME